MAVFWDVDDVPGVFAPTVIRAMRQKALLKHRSVSMRLRGVTSQRQLLKIVPLGVEAGILLTHKSLDFHH